MVKEGDVYTLNGVTVTVHFVEKDKVCYAKYGPDGNGGLWHAPRAWFESQVNTLEPAKVEEVSG